MAFITTTANSISSGGTISGDITIEGDLTVNGDGAGAYDEIVDGNLRISSTNKLEFGDTGTYIHQSADGVLDLVSDTEIEINATTIDMNGALDLSGNGTIGGTLTVGTDGSGQDVTFYSGTAGDSFVWDSSEEKLTITGTNGQTALDIADGNLVVADNVDIEGDIDVNGTLEADAITVDGVALNEFIADTVGAMVTSNTETNITVTYDDGDNTLDFSAEGGGTADNITVSANNSANETVYPIFVDGATGAQGAESDTGLTYNPSTGNLAIGGELSAATLDISGNIDIDGITNLDAVDIDGNVQLDGTLTIGTDGSGQDVIFYSGTSGDNFTWDSSEEKLTIVGTSGAVALDIHTGKATFGDSGTTYATINQNSLYFSNANGVIGTSTDHALRLNTNSEITMVLDSNSSVSISNNDTGGNSADGTGRSGNTLFGYDCGNSLTGIAYWNTILGHKTGTAVTTGQSNVLIGAHAAVAVTTINKNVVIGHGSMNGVQSGQAIEGVVAIGFEALKGGTTTTGINYSIALGWWSLYNITTGGLNTAIGYKSGAEITTGGSNVFIGYQSGYQTHGDSTANVAIGRNAFAGDHVTGSSTSNVAIGNLAMGAGACNGADNNVAVGDSALEDITEANGNVCVGYQAGTAVTTGIHNICIGYQAGNNITEGQGNVLIGTGASPSHAVNIDDSIVISAGTDAVVGGVTESIRIGVDSDYIENVFGTNASWAHSSDERIKKDIKDNTLGLDFINDLRTVTFKKKAPSEYPKQFEQYNPNKTERNNPEQINYGFVAQEVKEAMDKSGHSDFTAWSEGTDTMQMLAESELITPLVKAIQELTAKVEELENKLKEK